MLDLVAEVAGEHVKQLAARPVGRAEQLPVVPLAARLALDLLEAELVRARGEVPQKMIVNAHRLRARLAVGLPASTNGNEEPENTGNRT